MENNHHIDKIFQAGVKRYELRPSDDVWDRIESELGQTYAKTHHSIPVARYAAIGMLFLAVTLFSTPFGNPVLVPNASVSADVAQLNSINAAKQKAVKAPAMHLSSSTTRAQYLEYDKNLFIEPSSEPVALEIFITNTLTPATEESEFIFLPPVPEDNDVYAQNRDIYERIFNTDQPIEMLGFTYLGQDINNHDMEVMSAPTYTASYRDLNMRGMYIGVSGSYNQVSLLEYGNIFKGSRPIQPSLKFGHTKGLKIGYNINNNFGVEAEYVYNAVQGQNYVMSEDDEIVEKSLSLSYDLIPVTAKVKVGRISELTDKPIVLNYTAGVQYGMLRDARMPQDKRYEESAEELFKQNDVSVVLGLEYDVYLQDNLVVSAGARGTFSNDISTHIEPLNDYAKRNFVFGLRAGVSYVFR